MRAALAVALLLLGGCASAPKAPPREVDILVAPDEPKMDPEDAEIAICESRNEMQLWDCPTKT